jgi:flagellin-specific chaperone FliS
MRILSEYWTAIAETCYFLKQNGRKSMVAPFKGHKFIKIQRDVKMKVLRDHIRKLELQYIEHKRYFLNKVSAVSDIRLKISSKILLYLSEVSATNKTTSDEITKYSTEVYNYFIEELNKGSLEQRTKNLPLVSHLRRQITLLTNPDR